MTAGVSRMQDLSTMTSSSWTGPRPLTSSSGASCTCVRALKELWLCTVKVGGDLCVHLAESHAESSVLQVQGSNLFFVCLKPVAHNLLSFNIPSKLAWAAQAL